MWTQEDLLGHQMARLRRSTVNNVYYKEYFDKTDKMNNRVLCFRRWNFYFWVISIVKRGGVLLILNFLKHLNENAAGAPHCKAEISHRTFVENPKAHHELETSVCYCPCSATERVEKVERTVGPTFSPNLLIYAAKCNAGTKKGE